MRFLNISKLMLSFCLAGAVLGTFPNDTVMAAEKIASAELVRQAWEASGKNNLEGLKDIVKQCRAFYGKEAKRLQTQLKGFPIRGKEKEYQSLNDFATCLFVHGEALMNNGKTEEAIAQFEEIIAHYPSAQNWDPRGWYWSVSEKSKASIDVLTGKVDEEEIIVKVIRTVPQIKDGTEKVIDYTKYGKFKNVGTVEYQYEITNAKGLAAAIGAGIYPNNKAVFKDPRYQELHKAGRLKGGHWDFVNSEDLEAAYYKWLTAPEPWGTKLFYLGLIFEKSGLYYEALKSYHALIVHFPKSVAWTYWQTPWYPAQAAIAKIKHILRTHPELKLESKWMKIEVKNGFDNSTDNDVISTYPGVIREKGIIDLTKEKLNIPKSTKLDKIKKRVGEGKVQLVQYSNGHWQLRVNNKPFVIHGITYSPTKVGQSPDKGTLAHWMSEDTDHNGQVDGPLDSWVDANRNNVKDADEPVVGDFQLMKEMGVNVLREYHQPSKPDKELLRKMHEQYGIYLILGDFLGKYTLGSGASWFEGTDYENPEHKKNMLASVRQMVEEYKDEPYILMWLLGNENNYGVASNADKKPEVYYKFVNEVALMIKSIDKDHPVAIVNGDTLYLDVFAKNAPAVDIFAANVYRGDYGFGSFWEQVFGATGKPAFISEFGCPAFAKHLTLEEGEQAQADYHLGNWLDIEENLAGKSDGVGNALGGVVFEWTDEWWKSYEPFRHDKKSDAIGPFPGGFYYEEWFGITSQGNGQHSPFLRQLRKGYYLYKGLWNPGKS